MQSESLGTWLPVILATAFNFGDTLGRVVSKRKRIVYFVKLSHNRDLYTYYFSRLFLSSNYFVIYIMPTHLFRV